MSYGGEGELMMLRPGGGADVAEGGGGELMMHN